MGEPKNKAVISLYAGETDQKPLQALTRIWYYTAEQARADSHGEQPTELLALFDHVLTQARDIARKQETHYIEIKVEIYIG